MIKKQPPLTFVQLGLNTEHNTTTTHPPPNTTKSDCSKGDKCHGTWDMRHCCAHCTPSFVVAAVFTTKLNTLNLSLVEILSWWNFWFIDKLLIFWSNFLSVDPTFDQVICWSNFRCAEFIFSLVFFCICFGIKRIGLIQTLFGYYQKKILVFIYILIRQNDSYLFDP